MAAMSLEATLECTPLAPRTVKSEGAKHVDWTPGQWSGEDTEDSQEGEGDREEAESLIATDNEAMASLSEKKNKGWQIIMAWETLDNALESQLSPMTSLSARVEKMCVTGFFAL